MIKHCNLILTEPEALATADALLLLQAIVYNDKDAQVELGALIAKSMNKGHYNKETLLSLNNKVDQMANVFDPEGK